MLKSYERICKCGCGQIIDLKHDNYIVKENLKRNSYYTNRYHLPKGKEKIYDWLIEKEFIKEVKNHEIENREE